MGHPRKKPAEEASRESIRSLSNTTTFQSMKEGAKRRGATGEQRVFYEPGTWEKGKGQDGHMKRKKVSSLLGKKGGTRGAKRSIKKPPDPQRPPPAFQKKGIL